MSRHDPTEVTRQHVFKQKSLSNKEEQARIVVLAGKLAGDKYAIGAELIQHVRELGFNCALQKVWGHDQTQRDHESLTQLSKRNSGDSVEHPAE